MYRYNFIMQIGTELMLEAFIKAFYCHKYLHCLENNRKSIVKHVWVLLAKNFPSNLSDLAAA